MAQHPQLSFERPVQGQEQGLWKVQRLWKRTWQRLWKTLQKRIQQRQRIRQERQELLQEGLREAWLLVRRTSSWLPGLLWWILLDELQGLSKEHHGGFFELYAHAECHQAGLTAEGGALDRQESPLRGQDPNNGG